MEQARSYTGTFNPPRMAISSQPIYISGPGKFRIDENGIHVSAYKGKRAGGFFTFCAIAVVSIAMLWNRMGEAPQSLALGIIGLILFAVFMQVSRTSNYNADCPMEMDFPWSHVKKSRPETEDIAIVFVRTKLGSRGIWFHPEGRVEEFLNGINGFLAK